MTTEVKNAIISATFLGREDHGIFTANLVLDYGDSSQGFGFYALDQYDEKTKERLGHADGLTYLIKLIEVVGVNSWEELKGKYIRVELEDMEIVRIGNIIEPRWFDPKKIFTKRS